MKKFIKTIILTEKYSTSKYCRLKKIVRPIARNNHILLI